jgi:transcriptional regulator with XRE-family HTH domain
MDTFGSRLKHELEQHGITQADLSRLLGTDGAHVSHIVNGNRLPSHELLARMLAFIPRADARWLIVGGPYHSPRTAARLRELADKLEGLDPSFTRGIVEAIRGRALVHDMAKR